MTDAQKRMIALAGLSEADFAPKAESVPAPAPADNTEMESRVAELEAALSALLRGDVE